MVNGHLQAWASCKRTFGRFKTLMELVLDFFRRIIEQIT
jgi:hypothetical protein